MFTCAIHHICSCWIYLFICFQWFQMLYRCFFYTPTTIEWLADLLIFCLTDFTLGFVWYLSCPNAGKKAWYHEKAPQHSEIEQKDAKYLIPEGTRIWIGRVRGEWWGECLPFSCICSRWELSTNEGALKFVVKQLWEQALTLAGLVYSRETCPHYDYLLDAPPQ